MKNKSIYIIGIVYIILFAADLISTLVLGHELIQYLEVNIIYRYVGFLGIGIVNATILIMIVLVYIKSSKPKNRFLCLNLLTTICYIKVMVVLNNIRVYLSHPTVQQAMQVTQEQKTAAAVEFYGLAILPYLITFITYWLFCFDHEVKIK